MTGPAPSPLDAFDPDPIRAGILLAARCGIAVKVYKSGPEPVSGAIVELCDQACTNPAAADICWITPGGDPGYAPTCLDLACLRVANERAERDGRFDSVHLQVPHPAAPWGWERGAA